MASMVSIQGCGILLNKKSHRVAYEISPKAHNKLGIIEYCILKKTRMKGERPILQNWFPPI